MTSPDGYKPVIHKTCGEQYAWIKTGVVRGCRVRASDVMLLDGTKPDIATAITPCPNCGWTPTSQSLSFSEVT